MIYVIGAIIGLLASFYKKEKSVFALILLYAFTIYSFNSSNPDLVNYQNQYIGNFFGFNEPVYIGLVYLSQTLGLNFWVFRAAIAAIGLCLIGKTIYDYSPYPNINMFLFVLYPLIIDVVQIRFFLAYSIIVYSIRFILNYRDKRKISDIVKFFIALFLATGTHYSAVMYIILVVLMLNVEKRKTLVYVIVPITIILIFTNLPSVAGIASSFLVQRKVNRWILGEKNTTALNILRILVTRLSILFVLSLFVIMRRKRTIIPESSTKVSFRRKDISMNKYLSQNRLLFLATLYTELFCFLEIVVASEYERLTRPALVWGGILASRLLYRMEKNHRYICTLIWILLIVFYFLSQMLFQGVRYTNLKYFEYVFREVMENNLLYK